LAPQLAAWNRVLPVTAAVAWQSSSASGMPSPSLSSRQAVLVPFTTPVQLVQANEPGKDAYDPAGQLAQLVAAVVLLKVPAGQKVQEVLPGTSLKVPAEQAVQTTLPGLLLNRPAGHRVAGADPPVQELPAGQRLIAVATWIPLMLEYVRKEPGLAPQVALSKSGLPVTAAVAWQVSKISATPSPSASTNTQLVPFQAKPWEAGQKVQFG
jgi:hypothetical protein